MNLVELLYDYPYLDEKIDKIKAEIQRLSELKADVQLLDRQVQQKGDLEGMMEGLVCQQDKIKLALFELSREEYRFVELKYFERVKVEGILRELKRSRRSVYRLGDKVLVKLAQRILEGSALAQSGTK